MLRGNFRVFEHQDSLVAMAKLGIAIADGTDCTNLAEEVNRELEGVIEGLEDVEKEAVSLDAVQSVLNAWKSSGRVAEGADALQQVYEIAFAETPVPDFEEMLFLGRSIRAYREDFTSVERLDQVLEHSNSLGGGIFECMVKRELLSLLMRSTRWMERKEQVRELVTALEQYPPLVREGAEYISTELMLQGIVEEDGL